MEEFTEVFTTRPLVLYITESDDITYLGINTHSGYGRGKGVNRCIPQVKINNFALCFHVEVAQGIEIGPQ